jgi:hypothetical protein
MQWSALIVVAMLLSLALFAYGHRASSRKR